MLTGRIGVVATKTKVIVYSVAVSVIGELNLVLKPMLPEVVVATAAFLNSSTSACTFAKSTYKFGLSIDR